MCPPKILRKVTHSLLSCQGEQPRGEGSRIGEREVLLKSRAGRIYSLADSSERDLEAEKWMRQNGNKYIRNYKF
jgi:hypothetical protein